VIFSVERKNTYTLAFTANRL